ncbi:putative reverse transcriptase domain-containing protein [Tanacetum coccineum]
MAPKKNTTSMTDAQLKTLIAQGVADALAEIEANRSMNGDDSHDSGTGVRRPVQVAREVTYSDFLKCQPLNFKGTEGVVRLTKWFEKMESVFHISNCTVACQIKFATCTLQGNTLTWWNSHIKIERALMCDRMFPKESDKIEKYVGGWPDMIHGSVMASKPKTMQDAIEFTTELIDKKFSTFAERLMLEGMVKRNHMEDLNLCIPNETITMMVLVLPNAISATKLVIWTETVRVLQMPILLTTKGTLRQVRKLLAMNVVLRGILRGANPDPNVVMGTFLLNNRYASILFNIGTDRSFVSTAFSSQINITPTTLDHYYDVELADEKIIRINTIIQGCTLNFLNHPFDIDLMPIVLGSFDVIIGMDWLAKYHSVIVCAEKIVRIPFGNEILIVRGDESSNEHGT